MTFFFRFCSWSREGTKEKSKEGRESATKITSPRTFKKVKVPPTMEYENLSFKISYSKTNSF